MRVWRDGQEIDLGTAKQRTLLAVLLMEPNRTVSLDRLTTALWDDRPPKSAVFNLRTYAGKLRTALNDSGRPSPARIAGRHPGYALRVDPHELDSAQFTEHFRNGKAAMSRGRPKEAVVHLSAGLALWRGRPAEDVPSTLAMAPWLDSLDEQHCTALETIAAARLSLGEHEVIVPELRDLLAVHPTRERLWAHLMLALYQGGDIAAALNAYASAREMLRALGIDPGPELVDLHRAMLNRDPALAPAPRRDTVAVRYRRAPARHGDVGRVRRPGPRR
ncbi:hypothetical protein BJF79_32920 [Actinomadura sp. CNU-125]|nr:hypothetical protein BJF79_32920 [Actinomadura sp. CNU-125]